MPHGDERHLNNPCSPDVLEYAIPQNKYHDCQKPIELLQYLIENSSGKGEVILDPFAGSGSTLIAAAKCGRYYIGFELEKSYEPPFKRFLGDVVP
jgi:site-specific DNA-methyltransferase (adenine-specific)